MDHGSSVLGSVLVWGFSPSAGPEDVFLLYVDGCVMKGLPSSLWSLVLDITYEYIYVSKQHTYCILYMYSMYTNIELDGGFHTYSKFREKMVSLPALVLPPVCEPGQAWLLGYALGTHSSRQ